MKKGCFVALVTWAVFAGAYWYYFHTRFAQPLDRIVPVVAGFLMAIVVGNLQQGAGAAMSAIRASQQSTTSGVIGERPQAKDGDVITVVGPIRASGGSPLEAPLSKRPAVLYGYDISHLGHGTGSDVHIVKDFSGFALTPSVIDSRYGPMKLLGFPNLQGFPRQSIPATELSSINEYIASTPFQDMTGFNPVQMYREVKELMTDDDGQLRKDWRMTTDALTEENDFSEQIVAPGEQVTAIGRYSAAKGGIVQDFGSHPLQLIRGDAQVSSSALWKQAATRIIGALIFAAVVNGALFGLVYMSRGKPIAMPRSESQKRSDNDAVNTAAGNGDIPQLEGLIARGNAVDAPDAEMSTPLMHARDGKTAEWLIAHGANVNAVNRDGDTALMIAARDGKEDVVKALLKAKADPDIISTKWKSTALQQALDAEHLDIAQNLRDAGARDVTVNEKNGKPVGKNSEPAKVAMKYLDATQRQDLETMQSLTPRKLDKSPDWNAIRGARPLEASLVTGFANDKAATLALRGKRSDGMYSTWTFQLVRTPDGWKVSDERWETRLDGKAP